MNEPRNLTEALHAFSAGLDRLPIDEMLRLIREDSLRMFDSIQGAIPQIEDAVLAYAAAYERGGHIFYIGAGTSGRLGFVDAAELPATFGIAPDRVQVIFPGDIADASAKTDFREDDAAAGHCAVAARDVGPNDLAIGISASGETPFAIGAIKEAKERGATTAGIINNAGTTLEKLVDLPIVVITGPELIAGSTRLKAGTAQKVVLNMLSTAAMVLLGKVYDGFMVGLRANNGKLRRRAIRTLMALTSKGNTQIQHALAAADYEVDTALVMLKGELSCEQARLLLQEHRGNVRTTLEGLSGDEAREV